MRNIYNKTKQSDKLQVSQMTTDVDVSRGH